jgi:hypothetical protein
MDNKNVSTADFIALVAIVLLVISGSMNMHLMSENNRLSNEYNGFKSGCAYN